MGHIMLGMNKLPSEPRVQILGMMVEGMSLRAIARLTGASKNTIVKFLRDAGEACLRYQDEHLRGLTCKRIQVDEIWSFVHAKQKNVAAAKAARVALATCGRGRRSTPIPSWCRAGWSALGIPNTPQQPVDEAGGWGSAADVPGARALEGAGREASAGGSGGAWGGRMKITTRPPGGSINHKTKPPLAANSLGVPAPSTNRITSLIEWSSSESATPERSKRGITLLCGAHGATLKGANAADAALPANFIAFELPTGDPAWWFDIVDGLPDPLVERGSIEVWDRPGMGVELNPEKARHYLREEDAAFFE